MAIQRSPHDKKNPYVQINRKIFSDNALSWEAKGLIAYLISLPDDWKINVAHLCKLYPHKGGGEKAIYSMLNELIRAGYCERFQTKGDKGLYTGTDYHIFEFKKTLPHLPQGGTVEGDVADAPYTNKEDILNNKNDEREDSVVVPSFIQEIEGISESDKIHLATFPEKRVRCAIEFNKIEPVTTTKIQQLIWHCQQTSPPIAKIKSKKNDLHEKCVEMKRNYNSNHCEIIVKKECIVFVHQGQGEPREVKFSQENASEEIWKYMKFYKFRENLKE